MFKSNFKKILGAMCILMSVYSCNKEPKTVAVQSVKLNESSILLYEGETQQLKAVFTPKDATNQQVSWASDNSSVASVDDSGMVTAKAAGSAVITVTTEEGGKKATCEVTVQAKIVSVTGVNLNKTSLELSVGDKETLVATVLPENATNKNVSWSSSNDKVLTVNAGALEAVGAGEVVITVTTTDGNFKAECAVKVEASEYHVTFVSNGGSAVAPQTVKRGDKVVKPADPTKEGGLDAGLYTGTVDPDHASYAFTGWFTDEDCTSAYDFNTVPTGDLTLYAGWESSSAKPIVYPYWYKDEEGIDHLDAKYPEGFTPSDESKKTDALWVAFDYVNQLGSQAALTKYTYVVDADNKYEQGGVLSVENVEILVIGRGNTPFTLSHTWASAMFKAEMGHIVLGKNITISGQYGGQAAILLEKGETTGGGDVTMLAGSKLDGCFGTSRASAVYNNDGGSVFTLDGGEICNCSIEVGADKVYGGTLCANWGKFVIKAGKIHNNTVTCSKNTVAIGGAGSFPIKSRGNAFQKIGGEIYDNTATYTGDAGDSNGQQLVIGENNNPSYGVFKVDAKLGENDNLSTDDRETNTLWIKVK